MKERWIKLCDVSNSLLVFFVVGIVSLAQAVGEGSVPPVPMSMPAAAPKPDAPSDSVDHTGLIVKKAGVSDGYVLIATKECSGTYLVDPDGYVVHEWVLQHKNSQAAHLLPNGHLLRTAHPPDGNVGDLIEEVTWDGEVVWEYTTDRDVQLIHHNVEPLPNGNVLISVWERKIRDEYMAVGRNPDTVNGSVLWVDAVYEVKPTGKNTGEVVWRWSPWDHLVQDFDPKAPNYGNPADYPNRIDVNQTRISDEIPLFSDWLHVNSINYNAVRDEIIVSTHSLSEMWVVSHTTGDLLYRWGNPSRYGKGGKQDQVLFNQHNPHWIPDGFPGAGHLLIFNNEVGAGRGEGDYSTVLEVQPPLTESGDWPAATKEGFPPCRIVWEYSGPPGDKLYAKALSNAQRLKNGNTLICLGTIGRIVEVDPKGNMLWSYVNPVLRKDPPAKTLEKWHAKPLPAGNMMFRAYKYPPDYPAFKGRDVSPKRLLTEIANEDQNPQPVQ